MQRCREGKGGEGEEERARHDGPPWSWPATAPAVPFRSTADDFSGEWKRAPS